MQKRALFRIGDELHRGVTKCELRPTVRCARTMRWRERSGYHPRRVKLSVVIAAWNERENLEALTRRLHQTLSAQEHLEYELLYVLAGDDGTLDIARRLQSELGRMHIIEEPQPEGLGAALRKGFAAVDDDTDAVLVMDADLNHQPEEIPRLLASLERTRADLVIGSRVVAGSKVTGTPLWKRFLSGVLNQIMHGLFGGEVRDKTSGFRLYRASALRTIHFRQNDFSSAPEVVIQLQRAGFRIVEEPIHFIYRREGVSKMELVPTSLSYLSLLRGRFDRWSVVAMLILLLGFGVRLALSYPVHKYPADGDAVLAGLCAADVLGGDLKIFFNQARLGSLECYETAAVFLLFGVSRWSLALVSPLVSTLLLFFAHRLFRRLLGRKVACVALLLLAVSSPAVMFWLYMPNSYPTTMLVCAIILWLIVRAEQTNASRAGALILGVAIGIGFWTSFLTLMSSAPAVLWLAWRRADLRRDWRWIGCAALGFLLGAAPWIAYNVRYPLASFEDNFGARAAGSTHAASANFRHVVTEKLPELVASVDPENGVVPPSILQVVLRAPVLAIYLLAFALLAARDPRPRRLFWFVAALVLSAIALNTFSEAGQTRVLAVRYVLPMIFGVLIALAWFLAEVNRRSRVAAVVLCTIILAFNVAGYHWPGEPYRRQLERRAEVDAALVRVLEREGTEYVVGSYWKVYPFNFLTAERVAGVPCAWGDDFRRMRMRAPDGPVRWMALMAPHESAQLQRWMDRARVTGKVETMGEYLLCSPDRNSPLRPVLEACNG